ncbi:MAG: YlbF family regulator [Oscillospiraceae bacterium]|nr:YlbF family regulator [Oscillospiraceae bacterium]
MFEDNRIIAMTRSLGMAMQQESVFQEYYDAKMLNDADLDLQGMIDDFNTLQRKLDVEFAKEEKDTESIEELSNNLNQLYQAIMENENMKNYTEKREKFDIMTKFIDRILLVAMNGGDPYSVKEEDCTGNCANCHGCD